MNPINSPDRRPCSRFSLTPTIGRWVMAGLLMGVSLGCSTANPGGNSAGTPPASLAKITLSRSADYRTVSAPWGTLTWFVSGEQNNSATMTVGQAVIKPGMESPRHLHPNCEEVLHVVKGTILHALEDGKTAKMTAGDTITIPPNIAHNAKNIGTEEAVMFITFSTAYRKAVNQ